MSASPDDLFEAVRARANPKNPKMMRAAAMLDAVREAMSEEMSASGDRPITAYFVGLMTALEKDRGDRTEEILYLLSIVLPALPDAVHKAKVGPLTSVFDAALKNEAIVSSESMLRPLLICIGSTLRAQPPDAELWNRPTMMRPVHALLAFVSDDRNRIRRTALQALVLVLTRQFEVKFAVVSDHVGSYILNVLKKSNAKESSKALQFLAFVKATLPLLPPGSVKSICRALFRLAALGIPKLTLMAMRTVASVAEAADSALPLSFLRTFTSDLLDSLPPLEDVNTGAEYVYLLGAVASRLSAAKRATAGEETKESVDVAENADATLVAQVVKTITHFFESDKANVHVACSNALAVVLDECITDRAITVAHESALEGGPRTPVGAMVNHIESLLDYRFQRAWIHAVPPMGALYTRLGRAANPLLNGLTKGLVELRNSLDKVSGDASERAKTAKKSKRGKRRADDDSDDEGSSATVAAVQRATNAVVGYAIRSHGPVDFLKLVPLTMAAVGEGIRVGPASQALAESRAWVLPLLRDHVKSTPAPLGFFTQKILAVAKGCEAAANAASEKGMGANAKIHQTHSMQLWSLFPSFCSAPTDFLAAFTPKLGTMLIRAMNDKRYPELQVYVCHGLKTLVERQSAAAGTVGAIKDDDEEDSGDDADEEPPQPKSRLTALDAKGKSVITRILREQNVSPSIPSEDAEKHVARLRDYAEKFVPALFKSYEETFPVSADNAATVLEAITVYCAIAPPPLLARVLGRLMSLLGQTISTALNSEDAAEASKARARIGTLFGLARVLIPHAPSTEVLKVYRVLKPAVQDDALPACQKQAYKVLSTIFQFHPAVLLAPEHRSDVISLLSGSLLTCTAAAKTGRLICLGYMVAALDVNNKDQMALIPSALGEIMLCTKEANHRARNASFDTLLKMAYKMAEGGDDARPGPDEGLGLPSLSEMFKMVMAGLVAATPQMRSAATLAMSRLVYEFQDRPVVSEFLLPGMLEPMLMLFREKSREVVKSAVGFVKVTSVAMDREKLREALPRIVEALMSWSGESKNRLRAKIRIVFERFVRKFGYEEVAKLVPESDKPLLTHIRKQHERALRKKEAARNNRRGKAGFNELINEGDDSDGEGRGPSRPTKSRGSSAAPAAWLVSDTVDSTIDFLDSSTSTRLVGTDPRAIAKMRRNRQDLSDPGLEMSADGKLVIKEMEGDDSGDSESDDSEDEAVGRVTKKMMADRARALHAKNKGKKGSDGVSGGGGGGTGWGASKGKESKKGGKAHTAAAYRSSKAGGDVRKKDQKFEPYAYIPMDPKALSARGGNSATSRFEEVVASTSKHAEIKRAKRRRR